MTDERICLTCNAREQKLTDFFNYYFSKATEQGFYCCKECEKYRDQIYNKKMK